MNKHPRTVLWFRQRKKCESCLHLEDNRNRHLGMRCGAIQSARMPHCIDAREPTGICGPAGTLYIKRKDKK